MQTERTEVGQAAPADGYVPHVDNVATLRETDE